MRFFAKVPAVPPLIRDLEMLRFYLSAHGVPGEVEEVLGVTDDPDQSPIVTVVLSTGQKFNVHRTHYDNWLRKVKRKHEADALGLVDAADSAPVGAGDGAPGP